MKSSLFMVGGARDPGAVLDSRISNSTPLSEATGGNPGATGLVPRADHQHPRQTSTTTQSSTANGLTTVMFTRFFNKEPGATCMVIETAVNGPTTFTVRKWLRGDGADWVEGSDQTVEANQIKGCVFYAYRHRSLPTLNLSGILLIGPLLTALGVINNFAPYAPLEAGVKFSAIVVASSQQ